MQKSYGKRAVVIGGSITGMLSARVLADFFDEVTIFEADDVSHDKNARKRVPQGHHSHVLLQSGQQALERMFPNFINELIADGSVVSDFTKDLEWFHFGQWKKRFQSGILGVQQTRPFLEWHIQRRLQEYPTITFQRNALVAGFILSPDERVIQGIEVQIGNNSDVVNVEADFVVDASGVGSQSLKWLPNIVSQTHVETVKIDLFYATRFYQTEEPNLDSSFINRQFSGMFLWAK